MVYCKVRDQLVGKRCGKDIVSPSRLFRSMCSAGVIARHCTPLLCLCSNVDQGVVIESLLEGTKGCCITIDVSQDKHGSWWLQGHVIENSLNHGVGSGCCLWAGVAIGPPIQVIDEDGDLLVDLYCI